jgi:DNA-binding NtrC family response regulator
MNRGVLARFLMSTRSMNAVACAVADFSGRNSTGAPNELVRKISRLPEKSPHHVLVVDDEPLIRWSVTEALVDEGMVVEQATDAASALRAVTTAAMPFDVVVLDLRLPDMRDLSLLATIRQLIPAAALILMTAFGTPEIFAEAESLGAAVLNKPFELDELKRLIHN